MKGMFVKDLMLMKTQWRFFAMIIAIALIMTVSMHDSSFLLGYMTFIIPLFTLSTLSYDEYDNGNAFIFTLPVSRRGYVLEKYCFGSLLGASTFLLALLLSIILNIFEKTPISDTLENAPIIFMLMIVVLSVMFPIQLKFGAAKGRLALLVTVGITVFIAFAVVKILKHFDIDVQGALEKLSAPGLGRLTAVAAVVVLAVLLISIAISLRIIKKKEF